MSGQQLVRQGLYTGSGGSGGDVTPAELAAVEAKADAAQATANSKVSKAGDTMTGALTAPAFKGVLVATANTSKRTMSAHFFSARTKVYDSTLGIRVPVSVGIAHLLQMTISLLNFAPEGHGTQVIITGRLTPAGLTSHTEAIVFNQHAVNSVRFAWDGTNHWILLDTPSKNWDNPKLGIDVIWGDTAEVTDSNAIAVSFLSTAEVSAMAMRNTPVINQGLFPDSRSAPAARGHLNGATGAFTLKYGDIAVTKTGTGAYQIASGSLGGFEVEMQLRSAVPMLPPTWDAATSTLRTWDLSGNPADASGNIFVWI